jgi:hypothetical protein
MTANEASKFVRKQIKHDDDLRKGRFTIVGNTNVSVKEAVRIALDAAGLGRCNVEFRPFPHSVERLPPGNHHAVVGEEDADVQSMIRQSFTDFSRPERDSPYFSIVVVGRRDNFSTGFEARARNFLTALQLHIKKVPLADAEVVFVDYAGNQSLLHEIFDFPKLRIRWVIVPEAAHRRLMRRMNGSISFLEYVAKNIGIRRARGKFVLTTNPDDLLSADFFELIAQRQFNTALLYRAMRWDSRNSTTQTASELVQGLSEPWEMATWDVNQRCRPTGPMFAVIDSMASYDTKIFPCGAGDFILLSKKMWGAVEGFNEFPANANVDMVFLGRMFKFVPGFGQLIMGPLILHQKLVKKNMFLPSVKNQDELIAEYACSGVCSKCGAFAENADWGLGSEVFREVVA